MNIYKENIKIKSIRIERFINNTSRYILIISIVGLVALLGVLLTKWVDTSKTEGSIKLIAYPEKYSLAMSSTPGIRISAQNNGVADKVIYSTEYGRLFTWDTTTGKISESLQTIELPIDTPVYWSPLSLDTTLKDSDKMPIKSNISIKAVVFSGNIKLAEEHINIITDSTIFYTVKASNNVIISEDINLRPENPNSIEDAVSLAIKAQGESYARGEVITEGHVILDIEDKNGEVKVYIIASIRVFGFENGIFKGISGSGAIPTVITFSKDESNVLSLIEYKEPMDGAGNTQSIKKMFPSTLWDKVFKTDKYPELAKQQEEQAAQFLQKIGREAKVSSGSVEKKPVNINVGASNKLFAEMTKFDAELNNFPYWIGTKELVINGTRYIYETIQGKTDDGFDLVTFKKTRVDGTIVLEYQYKIVGSQPQLLQK